MSTPNDVLAALRETSCTQCDKLALQLSRAVGDHRAVARKAARRSDDERRNWPRLLSRTESDLADNLRTAVAHLDEPHAAPAPKVARVAAAPVEDTRPECPRCGVRVDLNARGRLRAHRGPSGLHCPRRLLTLDIVAPPVVLPSTPKRAPRPPRDPAAPSRLDVGSSCEDCGRWLPGERQLCGRCYVHRDTG